MKILAISGSLRRHSYNTALLRALQRIAPRGLELEVSDLAGIPLYDEELEGRNFPPAVERLAEAIREADGVLIATPEYNYSFPGVLKNAIDWLSRSDPQPFDGKAVALVGASMGGLGTVRAQYQLRQVFVYLNSFVMNRPEVFIGAAHDKFDESGLLTDAATREFLADFLDRFTDYVAKTRRHADVPGFTDWPASADNEDTVGDDSQRLRSQGQASGVTPS